MLFRHSFSFPIFTVTVSSRYCHFMPHVSYTAVLSFAFGLLLNITKLFMQDLVRQWLVSCCKKRIRGSEVTVNDAPLFLLPIQVLLSIPSIDP
jgi:hypothetical protein